MTAPASRNAPCPCGSGKRYKECHGALGATAAPAGAAPSPQARLMEEALVAQRSGRISRAVACYESVLAAEPGNFDALHMLGVALFQSGHLETALETITAALAIRDDVSAAHFNRELVAAAIAKRRQTELELAPEILPRLRPLCAEPVDLTRWTPSGEPVHVVVAKGRIDRDTAARVGAFCRCLAVTPTVWIGTRAVLDTDEMPELAGTVTRIDAAAFAYPRTGSLVVAGLQTSLAAWLGYCHATRVALLCDEYLPGELVDRLRELSNEGRRRVALFYSDAEVGRRLRLPGTALAPHMAATGQA